MNADERVLVVEDRLLYGFEGFEDGFSRHPADILWFGEIFKRSFFIPRHRTDETTLYAEKNPKYKQLIPYVVFVEDYQVLAYERYKNNEGRLTGKTSIGFGGHINPCDVVYGDFLRTLAVNVMRELDEELENYGVDLYDNLDFRYDDVVKGLIYDDSNPVGRDHLGALIVIDNAGVRGATPEMYEPLQNWRLRSEGKNKRLYPLDALHGVENLESWSRIALNYFK